MKQENTSLRLKKLMQEENLRQVDILELTKPFCEKYDVKMNKSDISQYVSGKVEPSQDKLVVLGMALSVSEAWLMGYDVPMKRQDKTLRLSKEAKDFFEKTDALEAELKVLGWTYKLVGCQDWVYIDDGSMGLDENGELVPGGKGRPIGCEHPDYGKVKCENCPERYAHYLFTNGEITFKVNMDEYNAFLNDSQAFFKERLQQLLKKSMKQMFTEKSVDNKSDFEPVKAAHARTDIAAEDITDEMKQHDMDIMNDPDF